MRLEGVSLLFYCNYYKWGKEMIVVLFWCRNTMLMVGLNVVKGEVEFWVCCGFLGISIVFARDMCNIVGRNLCFEKIEHTYKGHLVEGETIFEKTQHKILLQENLNFLFSKDN
jgi:hypothetical protein